VSRVFIMSFSVLLFVAAAFVFLSGAHQAAAQEDPPYKCYGITGTAPGVAPVDLQTLFGTETDVAVGAPAFLCEPAVKTFPPTTPTPPLPTVPPYKAYNITGAAPTPAREVTLHTQFGWEYNVPVGQPKYLGEPAVKTFPPATPTPPVPTDTPWKCYQITGPAPTPTVVVNLLTQLGLELNVQVGAPKYLCEPAKKDGVGDLTATPYKCYEITNVGAPTPNVVNLLTQFGTELNVPVTAAQYLCEPAGRHMETKVGGIAELPQVGGDSGWSTGAYAALAGGLAAAVLALAAGVVYAKRRLS